jgi:OmcA/MtrC family decaheme c-type cytochrome
VYRPDALESFLRGGLNLQIQKVEVNAPNVNVTFRISDSKNQGLDRLGLDTPGAINIGYTLARIKPGDQQYTSYYVAPPTGITQPRDFTDRGGTYQSLGDGVYRYTMALRLPSNFESNSTHTLGMWASRNLEDFGLGVPNANAVLDFVPSGAKVTQVRDIVRTQACNQCHDPLAAHGQPPYEFDRREVRICILCHYAGQINPETGNTVDERVFIHKLHMGANLPSVTGRPLNILGTSGSGTGTTATGATQTPIPSGYDPAALHGKPYQIIVTSENETFDASTIVWPQDVRNCTTCHQGGAQSDNWKTNPSAAACGSCHDDVNFTTGKNHDNIVQLDDSQCRTCHLPDTGLEFDLSIAGAHTIPTKSKQLKGLHVQILQVTNASPGSKPQVWFTVTDNGGSPVDASKLDRLMLAIAGPTSDYATEPPWQEDARKAAAGSSAYTYTFTGAIPAGTSGTWAVGAEAFRLVTISGPLAGQSFAVRESAFNAVSYFSVDGSDIVPRRKVVDLNNCNTCHKQLAIHGGARQNAEYCYLCHNPNHGDGQSPPETVNFPTMVHRIHMGVALDQPYAAGGTTGTDFTGTRFSGDPRNCAKCHVNNSYLLPLPDGLIPTKAPRFFYSPMQPTAAACLGCHNGEDAATHAYVMTTPLGESCAVCHQEGADFAVTKMHAQDTVWPPEDAR